MFAASGMMLADTALGRIQPVMEAPTLPVPEHPQTPRNNRVVFRDGSLAPGFAFGGPGAQRALLEAEGVAFLPDGRVDMARHQWTGEDETL